jgi:hypothetical protein
LVKRNWNKTWLEKLHRGRREEREVILNAETKPTPNPAKNRPATNNGISVAAVCKMTPNMKTMEDTISDQRRPMRSAIIDEASAPKKVPAERIETISDCCDAVIMGFPFPSLFPVENSFSQ